MTTLKSFVPVVLLLTPRIGWACAVCFGDPSSGMARGFYWGILILLALPFALLAGFVAAVAVATRRKRAASGELS